MKEGVTFVKLEPSSFEFFLRYISVKSKAKDSIKVGKFLFETTRKGETLE